MDHVAIMKKSWGLIPKILTGEKKIESRWYQHKRAPWDKIKAGDTVFFKNSGEPVKIKAKVYKVLQFSDLNPVKAKEILEKYGKDIGIAENQPYTHSKIPERRVEGREWVGMADFLKKKYCLLIFLKNPVKIKSFQIDKSGFGSMSAWISVKNINKIKKYERRLSFI